MESVPLILGRGQSFWGTLEVQLGRLLGRGAGDDEGQVRSPSKLWKILACVGSEILSTPGALLLQEALPYYIHPG